MQVWKNTSIGCDFSSTTAYLACANNQKVAATANVDLSNLTSAIPLIQKIFQLYQKEYQTSSIVWIEQPWVNAARNPKVAMMMMRTATVLEIVAALAGMEPKFVHPLSWRKELYGSGKTLNSKEYAVDWVKINLNYEVQPIGKRSKKPDHNIAEAVCIAVYGSMQGGKE